MENSPYQGKSHYFSQLNSQGSGYLICGSAVDSLALCGWNQSKRWGGAQEGQNIGMEDIYRIQKLRKGKTHRG